MSICCPIAPVSGLISNEVGNSAARSIGRMAGLPHISSENTRRSGAYLSVVLAPAATVLNSASHTPTVPSRSARRRSWPAKAPMFAAASSASHAVRLPISW